MTPRTRHNFRAFNHLTGTLRGLTGEALDEFIDWRLTDPKLILGTGTGANMAQRQWTIEFRADFSDEGKVAEIDQIVRNTALYLRSLLLLLKDAQEPQVSAYSDDFFHTHKDIALWATKGENPLGDAIKAHEDKVVAVELSDVLLEAVQDMEREKQEEANKKAKASQGYLTAK